MAGNAAVGIFLKEAKHHVQFAVEQETDDGNPIKAAAHYVRAVELIMHAVNETNFTSPEAAAWCLSELNPKLSAYLDRASLLQRIATDCPPEAPAAGDDDGIPQTHSEEDTEANDALYANLPQDYNSVHHHGASEQHTGFDVPPAVSSQQPSGEHHGDDTFANLLSRYATVSDPKRP
jgi:hypothetical protein